MWKYSPDMYKVDEILAEATATVVESGRVSLNDLCKLVEHAAPLRVRKPARRHLQLQSMSLRILESLVKVVEWNYQGNSE